MNVHLNGVLVEELTLIVHALRATQIGRAICIKLRETVPAQQYTIAIQATVGGKILARETVKPLRKNVVAKLVSYCFTKKKVRNFIYVK